MWKRKIKKCLVLGLAFAMMTGVAGCGKEQHLEAEINPDIPVSEVQFPLKEQAELSFITSAPATSTQNPNERIIFKRLEKQTNVHIDWTCFVADQFSDKKNLALAQFGNLPDGLFNAGMSDYDLLRYAKQGIIIPVENLIDKYEDWYYANPLIEAVKSGKIPMSLVDEKVGDVLRVMIKTNVLDPKKRFGPGSMNTKEHQQATYDAAAEAIVLLKNQNNLLPLDFSSIKSLAVIGDNATRKHSNGGLSSEIKAVYEVTPLEALRAKWGDKVDIRFAQGYEKLSTFVEGSNNGQSSGTFSSKTQESDALLKEAVEVARTSDVALLVCGLNHDYDTESFDRLNMDIPYGQVELIQEVVKANPRTIVVMIAGSPLNMAAVDICSPAIVWAWFNGMEGGNALVDVLSGKVNPSGKMPFTTPVSLDQSPAHALGNFPGRDLKVNYEEDILVGYRWFDTKGLPVVYPFGYGLSYTTFNYSNLNTDKKTYDQADTIQATFTLTNTGDREGAEVAQLYVSDPVCSVMRPVKELKGFKKVFLKPGESRRITLDIPVSSLAFYSEAQSQFVVEPGEFILQLGASTSDIKQKISIDVK